MDLFSTTYFDEISIFVLSKDQTFRKRCTLMNPEQFLILVTHLHIPSIKNEIYYRNVASQESEKIMLASEVAHLLADVLDLFPNELDVKRWDFIRITISSWVLSVSKSCDNFPSENVSFTTK